MKIAVTGASGFIGQTLIHRLQHSGHAVVPIVRRPHGLSDEIVTGSLEDADIAALGDRLKGVDAVAHLAARTHVLQDHGDALTSYRRVNVTGTETIARAAVTAGVRRFVYMSSIKVNGEATGPGRCFSGSDVPAPEDAYGRTKHEAEQAIARIAVATGLETVILRPPLVYGANVAGNFARLVEAVRRGIPLPFGLVNNRRSLISVDNLVDATLRALIAPGINGEILTLSDGEDVSTRGLVEAIGAALGRRPRLLPIPVAALILAGRLTGRAQEVRRLVGDLQVDGTTARAVLDWQPREQVAEALRHMLATPACCGSANRG